MAARAYEANDAIPYGPMIEILRNAVLRPAIDALGPQGRRRLARVLPGVDVDDPTVGADTGGDDRRQLFDAIAEVLVGSHRPLVTAIDDLHWCDPDTFDLIEAVLRAAAAATARCCWSAPFARRSW